MAGWSALRLDGEVWRAARLLALVPDQQALPPAARPTTCGMRPFRCGSTRESRRRQSPAAQATLLKCCCGSMPPASTERMSLPTPGSAMRSAEKSSSARRMVWAGCGISSRAYPVPSRRRRHSVAYGCARRVPAGAFRSRVFVLVRRVFWLAERRVWDSNPRGRVNTLAVFKIASGIWRPEAVTCVVGCPAGCSCQDHPVRIPRSGQISPDLSFTSLRGALVTSVPRSALMLGRPGPPVLGLQSWLHDQA